jgi:hypothetical protein
MEEIEIGEYVRTKSGNIGKVLDITNVTMQKRKKYLIKWNISKAYYITAIRIVKHSKNIIDLIEEGDYVNGKEIIMDLQKSKEWYKLKDDFITCKDYTFEEKEIKRVVTKEQFNSIAYRLEE